MKESRGGDYIPKSEDAQELETILIQHWTHSRHCETQILWFTNIYAAVVAAILVFIGKICESSTEELGPVYLGSALLLAFYGLVLSVIGFLIVIALSLGHQNYIMNIVVILNKWGKTEFYRDWHKPIHYKTVHRWFFEINIALFGVLLLFYGSSLTIFQEHPALLILIFVCFLVIIDGIYRGFWGKSFEARKKFIEKLHPDFWEKPKDC